MNETHQQVFSAEKNTVDLSDPIVLRRKATIDLPIVAQALIVETDEQLRLANDYLVGIRLIRARINAFCDPNIALLHKGHQEAIAQKKALEGPVIEAEALIKSKMRPYMMEQERKRREAEEAARAEARKAELEKALIEAVRRRREQEALDAALKAEAEGRTAEAEKIIEETVEALPVIPETPKIIVPEKPKLEGTAVRHNWKFRIVNEAAIPREYLVPDYSKIGSTVRTMKDKTNIAGVEAYMEIDPAAGPRR